MTDVTEAQIYIQARDDEGDMYNRCVSGWVNSGMTTLTVSTIRARWAIRRERGWSNRQCLGFDPIEFKRRAMKKRKHPKKDTVDAFFKKRLVA